MQALISFSFERMKQLLFPFNFKRWLKILVIVWLAGAAGGGGSGGGNWGDNINKIRNQQKPAPVATTEEATNLPVSGSASGQSASTSLSEAQTETTPAPENVSAEATQVKSEQAKREAAEKFKRALPWIIAGVILIGLPLMFLFMWLASRFQFILFSFLTRGDLAIRRGFTAYREIGNSAFVTSLVLFFVVFGSLLLPVGLFFLGPIGIFMGVLAVILWILAVVALGLVISDFIIPIMFSQNVKFKAAVRLFREQKFNVGQIILYYLVKLGLGIVAAIALAFLGLIVVIALGIPVGIGVVLALALIKSAAVLKIIGLILFSVFVLAGIVAMIVGVGLVSLPVHIFFQCFRLAFVTKLLPNIRLFQDQPISA